MATAGGSRTYLSAVNEVLATVGEAELTSPEFTSAVANQKRVQRIVGNVVRDLQNSAPDEHWQAYSDFRVLPIFTTGGVTVIADDVVTFTGVNFTTDFEAQPLPYVANHCYFKLNAETQWYPIRSKTSTTTMQLWNNHQTYTAASPFSPVDAVNGDGYQIMQVRYDLPSDFRDVQDLYKPFEGVDVKPGGKNSLIRRMMSGGTLGGIAGNVITDTWPRQYAIGYDTSARPATAATDRIGPHMWLWPIPIAARDFRLLYQRHPYVPEPGDAGTVVLDLPVEMMYLALNRAKMVAKLEIQDSAQTALVYKGLADEEHGRINSKTMTKSDTPIMAPDQKLYRAFFRKGRRTTRGPRIVVDE